MEKQGTGEGNEDMTGAGGGGEVEVFEEPDETGDGEGRYGEDGGGLWL